MSTRERRDRSNESDRFLSQLFHKAIQDLGEAELGKEIALAAVGGYGRGELSPGSDLDIIFLHSGKLSSEKLKAFVNEVLYPLWDTKSVDHSVRTRSETRDAASSDLRVAAGLLDIRFITGNSDLVAQVQSDSLEFWRKNAKENLAGLHKSLQERHVRAGELAYLLEPDLKEARGGLRDIQALRAISLAAVVPVPLEKIRKHFIYAYCQTAHSLQGSSIDSSITIFDYKFYFVATGKLVPKLKVNGTELPVGETRTYPCISWCSALQKSVQ